MQISKNSEKSGDAGSYLCSIFRKITTFSHTIPCLRNKNQLELITERFTWTEKACVFCRTLILLDMCPTSADIK